MKILMEFKWVKIFQEIFLIFVSKITFDTSICVNCFVSVFYTKERGKNRRKEKKSNQIKLIETLKSRFITLTMSVSIPVFNVIAKPDLLKRPVRLVRKLYTLE